ncbi:MAG: cytochrome c3 family protein [Nitrospinae bacterium]|nr:cytochrome c3 family protein [Nitrospinota bacterium]
MNQTFVVVATLGMILTALLGVSFTGGDTAAYLPAPLSPPHARFAAACEACHVPWRGVAADRCLTCHRRGLAKDLHAADRLEKARSGGAFGAMRAVDCVDCHREHRPTREGGFTGPPDLCLDCHREVEMVDRHPGIPGALTSTGCRDAGCHRYHQGVAAPLLAAAEPIRIRQESLLPTPPPPAPAPPIAPEALAAMKASPFYRDHPIVTARYEIGAHYGGQATCDTCHLVNGKRTLAPPVSVCGDCHKEQTATFVHGRHGAAAGFDLRGKKAPLRHVGCGDCHDPHSLKTGKARREACLSCHDTLHTRNYEKSAHWRQLSEPLFALSPLTAPDCAGCHMPRRTELGGRTDHNETLSAAAPERMAVDVCLACHGLAFSLSALFDPAVVASNFTYAPPGIPDRVAYALSRRKERP